MLEDRKKTILMPGCRLLCRRYTLMVRLNGRWMRNAIGCQINRHDMCFYLHVAMLPITCRYCDAPMSLVGCWLVTRLRVSVSKSTLGMWTCRWISEEPNEFYSCFIANQFQSNRCILSLHSINLEAVILADFDFSLCTIFETAAFFPNIFILPCRPGIWVYCTSPVNTLTSSRRQYDVLHIGSNRRHCDIVPTSFAHRPAVGLM